MINEIARDEELDGQNPLRHLMHSGMSEDDQDECIVPPQRASIHNQIHRLSFLDAGGSCSIDICLHIDATPGCGGIAWPAGTVLSAYLVRRSDISGRTIIELGSGTGLVGLVAAKLGAAVWITDQALVQFPFAIPFLLHNLNKPLSSANSPLLPAMRKNVDANDLTEKVTVAELNWGEPLPANLPPRPDIILAADCVYYEPAFSLLVQTLSELSDPQTDILFCYKKRRKADKRFFSLLKKKFIYTEISDKPYSSVYRKEAVSLLKLTKISKD